MLARRSDSRRHWTAIIVAAALIACIVAPTGGAPRPQDSAQQPSAETSPARAFKSDPRKAKDAYRLGVLAEKASDWQTAYTYYSDAADYSPDTHEYLLRREIAKSRLVQVRVDTAEREAVSGRLDDARRELLSASYIDPSNTVVRERLMQLIAADPDRLRTTATEPDLAGEPQLAFQHGTHNFDYRGDTQGAYEELARQFGVDVAFDVDLRARQVRFQANDVDFLTAARLLGNMTATFWRPLSPRLFFVSDNTAQKRRDYDASAVRTILLPASETPEQMTEMLRVVRDVTGITRSQLDTRTGTLTLRASPSSIAIATDLLEDLEQPVGEMILEIEVLEVDRTSALNLGVTPPETSRIVSLNTQEIQEAEQSLQGLISVITQVFGQPSALSGLSATQISTLLSAGQIGAGSVLPPVVLFGGGLTTFAATMPGASANFAQMLSMVRQGRRILLRAKDGQPATFFVGDRIPVSLATFSNSFAGTGANVAGVSSSSFPTTNFAVGKAPSFVVTSSLRNNGTSDIVAANSDDNTISVLLGDGTGTFATPVTYPTGTDPVWIATGQFNASTSATVHDEFLDLAVANQTSNTVSILLGNGDGTFQPKTDLAVGTMPVSVVAANFHDASTTQNVDLAVANQASDTISILQGNGDGTFQPPANIILPAGFKPTALVAADFNNDGHVDLAGTSAGSNLVQIFLGKGDGTFTTGTNLQFATGTDPVYAVSADFNTDGNLDLAVANQTDNTVSILLGNGDGTFAPATNPAVPAGNAPTALAVADVNVDGLPDLLVADKTDNAISILLNLSGGLFGPNFELPVDTAPVSVASADFNGGAGPDAVTANSGANDVTVVLNSSSFLGGAAGTPNGLTGSVFPGVEYLDIGLKVKATPRIHPGGEVTLQMNFDISSLAGQSYNSIPVINNQTITQTVRLKENETAALAGFLQSQLTNAIAGTPGIAGIPGAGLIASTINPQREDSELLILVTPRLVRLAPRQDHLIYAGPGAPEGSAAGAVGGTPVTPVQAPPGVAPLPSGIAPAGAPAPSVASPPQNLPPAGILPSNEPVQPLIQTPPPAPVQTAPPPAPQSPGDQGQQPPAQAAPLPNN